MKKKTLCIVLALILMVGMFAGCGKKEGSGDKIVLTFWGHSDLKSWTDSWQKIAADFTKENPNIEIKFEFFPYDEFESKVLTSLSSKTGGADLYEMWGGWGVDFAPTGALAALPDDMAKEIMEDSYPSTYSALLHDGKLYGIPLEFNIESGAMLVNKHILAQYGFEVAKTWDELIEQAKAMTVIENGVMTQKGFDFANWDGVTYLFLSMILSQGGQYLNEDGTQVNFMTDEARTAFQAMTDLVLKDKVTNTEVLTDTSAMEGYMALFSGKVAYVPRGPWVISDGITTFGLEYGVDFDYVAMPWFGSKPGFAAETGWAAAVNNNSPNKEAAFKFLEYLYRDDVIMSHNIACAQLPAKKSVAQNPEYVEQFPYAKPLVGILEYGQFIGYFNTDVVKEALVNGLVDYCLGEYASIDAALQDIQNNINK